MNQLSLTYLGTFQAVLDKRPVENFRSAKVQALLVFLSLTPQQAHNREVLATFFWPDELENAARRNLRQSLFRLRKVLGDTNSHEEPFLLVTRSTIQFNAASDHSLDVNAFFTNLKNDRHEQAIALYQGELLPGFTCESRPFEDWLRQEREGLHRRALEAISKMTARSLAEADYNAAQNLARRQLAIEPWREEAHRQLMHALALLGDRTAALAQHEACRLALEKELNVEPSEETKVLAARIRNLGPVGDAQAETTTPIERHRLTIPFVGRKSEHGQLVRAYQQACTEGARIVTLVGEVGIGKTRLAQHFLDWASTQGADVLHGRAFETSGRLSYQSLTQAMRQRLDAENAPEDLLSELWLTQLTRILPELRDRYPDLPQPTQEESTARQHLFEAITRLAKALAERAPLILFIDDWHWADIASMDVLHYAAMRWSQEKVPILILLTLRQEAVMESPDLQTWLSRIKHNISYVQLNLTGLSIVETEELIQSLLISEKAPAGSAVTTAERGSPLHRFSRRLFDETDGQPFFLVETLKAFVDAGLFRPEPGSVNWRAEWAKLDQTVPGTGLPVIQGVQEIIQGWLELISQAARELLAAAAVLGQEASFDRLYRVARLDENQGLTALDELLSRQLLLEADDGTPEPGHEVTYNFSHQKLAEVVYNEAGAARRRILHRRAFEVLAGSTAPSAELAHHALHSGKWVETIRNSLIAANEAMDLFAVGVAVAHYETALQVAEQTEWPEAISGADRQDLYAGLGRAYELTESWEQAKDIYLAMTGFARTINVPALECQGLNRLATVYINGFDDLPHAITLLEQAQQVAEQSGDQQGMAETEWNLSVIARKQHEIRTARHHGEHALTIARQMGHPQLLARCLNSLAYVHSYLRQWEMVERFAEEAHDLYEAAGNRILAADSRRLSGWSMMFAGRPEDGLATILEAFTFSKQIENLWGEAECTYRLAHIHQEMGHYGQAIHLANMAVRQAQLVGVPTMILLALSTWGTIHRSVLALEAGQEKLSAALPDPVEGNSLGFGDWILAELCALYALSGNWDKAHDFARLTIQARARESLPPISLTSWYETEALLRGGDADLARTEVENLAEFASNNLRYQLLMYRSRAVLARWDGDLIQAIAHLEKALALAREIGLPGEVWPVLGELGGLYAENEAPAKAKHAYHGSAAIILQLAETIDEEDMRAGFLAAGPVRSILETSEIV